MIRRIEPDEPSKTCQCPERRDYSGREPGAAAGRSPRSFRPAVSAFPGRVTGSACTSSFSRLARRSLALQPAHSRGHQFVTRYPKASDISSPPCLLRLLPAGANRRVGLAPTGKRRLVTAHPRDRRFRSKDHPERSSIVRLARRAGVWPSVVPPGGSPDEDELAWL